MLFAMTVGVGVVASNVQAAHATTAAPAWTVAQMQSASAVVEGASGSSVKSTIYVFMDPNCIYCHLTWKALQPYESAGLQVHWIPIAFLKPDSTGKAAALIQAQDAPALLKTLEANYSEKTESGGIAPLASIPAATQAKLDANFNIFKNANFDGTPTIIYKKADGTWADVDGFPKLRTLPTLLGLPAQTISDAELKTYY
jgi:thiol:disulfide interchange protein DsbG